MSNTSFYTLHKIMEWEKVSFYTVREEAGDQQLLWFFRFLEKLREPDARQIRRMMKQMGTRYGAKAHFFRHEGEADALPSNKVHFVDIDPHVRLYCLRLNDKAVILFSGGYKHAATAQDSGISFDFQMANLMARKIRKAIADGRIRLNDDMRLEWDEDLLL